MKIAIVILNYNGRDLTIRCLESIQKLVLPSKVELDTIVVDNDSSDSSVREIDERFPSVKLIVLEENTGFAKGNNLGYQKALEHEAEYVLILNNDTYLEPKLLSELLIGFEHHPRAAIVSPKIYFAPGHEFHQDRYKVAELGKVIWFAGGHMDWKNLIGHNIGVDQVDKGQYDNERQLTLTTGCCMLIKTSKIVEPLFDERYFMYYEDADLCQRVIRANKQIWYIPSAKLWHINAGSSGSGSDLQDYFISRNRMLFGMQHAPIRTKLALYREGLRLMFSGREWQKQGIKDYFKRNFGQGSYFSDNNENDGKKE